MRHEKSPLLRAFFGPVITETVSRAGFLLFAMATWLLGYLATWLLA
jgi:hypothetical protein